MYAETRRIELFEVACVELTTWANDPAAEMWMMSEARPAPCRASYTCFEFAARVRGAYVVCEYSFLRAGFGMRPAVTTEDRHHT